MIHADTDGLLDKCHCGAVAGFEELYFGTCFTFYSVKCTDCAEQINAAWDTKGVAATEWNKLIRSIKKQEPK
jgi:hypothetical protein